MASSSRRRLRTINYDDTDDDENVSRQSTPISTALNDRKRIRRSNDTDDEISNSEPSKLTGKALSQSDQKPRFDIGPTPNHPKHQTGAIVRVKLVNFVTYTSAEFFPGPTLNMVIGPNGTGKSTLVCAICLGLGWGTQYLGRAKDAAEFVKHGSREATIEIELQRALKGKNATRVNPIITRTIKREGNKSTYTLNGTQASGKAVMELARSFDIQIDNLCQFLPQDKVVEFAQMTPIEILSSTQRAAAPAEMLQWHDHLKALRKAQKEQNDNSKNDRETLANLENRQEMQRTEVERLRERAVVQKRLGWLMKCRPVPLFLEAKLKINKLKAKQKQLSLDLQQLRKECGPTLKKVEAKRVYATQVQDHKKLQENQLKKAVDDCGRIAKTAERHQTAIEDCNQIESAEQKSGRESKAELLRIRTSIVNYKKQKERQPEPFDSRAANNEIQAKVTRVREVQGQLDEIKSRVTDLKAQAHVRTTKIKRLDANLEQLSTQAGRQEDRLKSESGDTHRAWEWIKQNREMFQKEVYGPPMVECTLNDPSMASRIESILQKGDFKILTVQCKADFTLLQKELYGKQRLHDVSLRVCPFDSLERFQPPLDPAEMQQYGLKGWAIDFIDGPLPVKAMLCQEKFLHQCAMTDTDVSQAQHDQMSRNAAVKSYISRTKAYQFVRRAEYGAAGIHAKERPIRPATIWTSQPVDSGRRQIIQGERRELKGEIQSIGEEIQQLGGEMKKLVEELKELEEDAKRLREDKDEKQKALAEYNGLSVKIADAEGNAERLQQNLNSVLERMEENAEKRRQAMFAKADAVLEYCQMVHSLKEKTKLMVESEVAYIEAKNDYDVLSERHQTVKQMLEDKQKEEKQALRTFEEEKIRAHKLADEVKKLRDDGEELEEKENDSCLTDLLGELTANANITLADLEDLIKVEQAKLELTEGGDANTIKDFEERAKKIDHLRSRLTKMTTKQQDLIQGIREIREQWEGPLDALVAKISDAFGDSFARIGCAGQVTVHKASSDDPVDCTEELGGSENGLDFANWAIHISVKFRENEALSLLDSHRQSGGERAVSTIFYLMALQSLSRAPFRVVDEINQGMDPRNERMVHGRMVDIAAADENGDGSGSQYFLITPKLLSGLKYKAGMTVLCIVSGENMPSATDTKARDENGQLVRIPGRRFDFGEFVKIARELNLNPNAGMGSHLNASITTDSFGRLGRNRAEVYA